MDERVPIGTSEGFWHCTLVQGTCNRELPLTHTHRRQIHAHAHHDNGIIYWCLKQTGRNGRLEQKWE